MTLESAPKRSERADGVDLKTPCISLLRVK
jgi:hypothetical protein